MDRPLYIRPHRIERAIPCRTPSLDTWRSFAGADPAIAIIAVLALLGVVGIAYSLQAYPLMSRTIVIVGLAGFLGTMKILRSVARYDKNYFWQRARSFDPWSGKCGPIEAAYLMIGSVGKQVDWLLNYFASPLSFVVALLQFAAGDWKTLIGILLVASVTTLVANITNTASPGHYMPTLMDNILKYYRAFSLAELALIAAFAQVLASSVAQVRQIIDSRLSLCSEVVKQTLLSLRESILSERVENEDLSEFRRQQIKPLTRLLRLVIRERGTINENDALEVLYLGNQIHDSVAIQYVYDEFFDEIKAYSDLLWIRTRIDRRATLSWVMLAISASFVAALALSDCPPTWAVLLSVFLALVTPQQLARRQLDI